MATLIASFSRSGLTSRFLADPFTAFDPGFWISHSVSQAHPALLYLLNSNGLPLVARSSDPSSVPLRQLQVQVDSLQHRVETGPRAFAALAAPHEQTAQRIQDTAQATTASIAGLSATIGKVAGFLHLLRRRKSRRNIGNNLSLL